MPTREPAERPVIAPPGRGTASLAALLLTLASMNVDVGAASAEGIDDEPQPTLAERVAEVLEDNYYDEDFRDGVIPEILERHLDRARAAETIAEQRQAAHEMLSEIPISHLGLMSHAAHTHMLHELWGRRSPTFGFSLVARPAGDGRGVAYVVDGVLEGGPADRAGLLEGHEVVAIDGTPPGECERLDWRTDDSHLDDPATHMILGELGDAIRVEVVAGGGQSLTFEVEMDEYSVLDAIAASFQIDERPIGEEDAEPARIGYLHLPMVPLVRTVDLVREKIVEGCASCDALVLDLRGRGGSAQAIEGILDAFEAFEGPRVALIDRGSRSAKDVLAYEIRERGLATLVGETTAGAVIPAAFADVGDDTWLMFPGIRFGDYTDLLEGHGVAPDVEVAGEPAAPGADPIRAAGLEVARQAVAAARAADEEAALVTAPGPGPV